MLDSTYDVRKEQSIRKGSRGKADTLDHATFADIGHVRAFLTVTPCMVLSFILSHILCIPYLTTTSAAQCMLGHFSDA